MTVSNECWRPAAGAPIFLPFWGKEDNSVWGAEIWSTSRNERNPLIRILTGDGLGKRKVKGKAKDFGTSSSWLVIGRESLRR